MRTFIFVYEQNSIHTIHNNAINPSVIVSYFQKTNFSIAKNLNQYNKTEILQLKNTLLFQIERLRMHTKFVENLHYFMTVSSILRKEH